MQPDSEEAPQTDMRREADEEDDDCAELSEVLRRRRRELEELFAP